MQMLVTGASRAGDPAMCFYFLFVCAVSEMVSVDYVVELYFYVKNDVLK